MVIVASVMLMMMMIMSERIISLVMVLMVRLTTAGICVMPVFVSHVHVWILEESICGYVNLPIAPNKKV